VSPSKIKKTEGGSSLELVRTPDILRSLGRSKGPRLLVGFAAETEDLLANARRKRAEKNLDLIVANDVSSEGTGFGGDANAAVLIDASGREVEVPLVSKQELAERIWDRVVDLRKGGRGDTETRRSRTRA
jgi:phosphopantothenoylcysteine decarboxylase/phosphopantothenate--cysteine ligase